MDTEKKTYSVEELAFTLGISKGSCYALIKEGQFQTVRVRHTNSNSEKVCGKVA